jgi:hypothetical protein
MENHGCKRLSEELAVMVKVVIQAVYFIRAGSFNNRSSNQICSGTGSEYEQLFVIMMSGVCHEETLVN